MSITSVRFMKRLLVPGPTLGIVTWDGKLDELVQRINLGADAAASLRLDHRVTGEVEQVSGADDIGLAEQNDAVAVRCASDFRDDHGLVVEEEPLPRRR